MRRHSARWESDTNDSKSASISAMAQNADHGLVESSISPPIDLGLGSHRRSVHKLRRRRVVAESDRSKGWSETLRCSEPDQ